MAYGSRMLTERYSLSGSILNSNILGDRAWRQYTYLTHILGQSSQCHETASFFVQENIIDGMLDVYVGYLPHTVSSYGVFIY